MLLVVLGLVMSIVLSIAARSLTEVVLSRQERENNAAFAMAETGVEQALVAITNNEVPVGVVDINGTVEADITGQYRVNQLPRLNLYLKAGEESEVLLAGYTAQNIVIEWTKINDLSENLDCVGQGSNRAPAALEVVALGETVLERRYVNAYNCNLSNNFEDGQEGTGEYRSRLVYGIPAGTAAVRIKLLYSGATIAVRGTMSGLPTQMYLVQVSAEGSESEKEIEVKRSRESPGSIFDYALFSGESIVK